MNHRLFGLSAFFICACLAGCGGSSVGQACSQSSDCDTAQTCYLTTPGGTCSKGCAEEGSSKDCPGGSVCASHGSVLLCSRICQSQGDCRAEYECNGLTGSSVKACRPKAK